MFIRPYIESDNRQLELLMEELQGHFADIDSSHELIPFRNMDDCRSYMAQIIQDVSSMEGALFVAIENQEIIGFVQGIINRHQEVNIIYDTTHNVTADGWIGLLFVKTQYRGKKLGYRYLIRLKPILSRRGAERSDY